MYCVTTDPSVHQIHFPKIRSYLFQQSMNCLILATTKSQSRGLSSFGKAALSKLRCALEDYRLHNYTQELPSRFKKEIAKAAVNGDSNTNCIPREGMERVLRNIGAMDRVSAKDMNAIFSELGNRSGEIPIRRFINII